MDFGFIPSTLQTVAHYWEKVQNATAYYTTQSLPEATKLTRVEPLTIVSKDLLNLEYLADVQSSLCNIAAAYYLQAVAILTKVTDVEVVKTLDRLNPDRDSTGFLMGESLAQESIATVVASSYKHSLPIRGVALEQEEKSLLSDVSNLSVGKLLQVDIAFRDKDGSTKNVKVPVQFRLATTVVPVGTIRALLAHSTQDESLVERYHSWRAGRIEGIRDLIFAEDLIQEHRKNAIEDDTGTAAEIMRRVANSKKFGLMARNPSLNTASNLFVISEENAREIESKLGGKLSNARIRQKAFENTYAMIIVVVDREWERVIFYTRGIEASMNLSVKEIKAASKGKGPDVADILKAFTMGAPAF